MYLWAAVSEKIGSSRPIVCYERLEEDREEGRHLQAQFLIYKTLAKADAMARRRPSFVSCLRLRRLKIKIGRRLSPLRKTMLVLVCGARSTLKRRPGGRVENSKLFSHRKIALPPVIC